MRRTIPLREWPQLTVVEYPGWHEYRVDAAGISNGRKLRSFGLDAALVVGIAYYCRSDRASRLHLAFAACLLLWYLYHRMTQVLWESIIIIPSLGLQLETHRGFTGIALSSSRRFLPWSSLEDFLINEGLRGWNVRYYLVAITRTQQGALKLEVAFKNTLPRFPILLEVYHAVQEALDNGSEPSRVHSSISTSTNSEDNK
ncbi:hypothetical protein BV20DRAFT_990132 [Pilatotrama ljubarskyi]|nr:hypothetical protein BV20DRAFT_990132 [Pilatotrama ljubarskyi]